MAAVTLYIQELREARGMPKAELARRAGTTRNTLYRIEAGKTTPSSAMVEQLARGLDLEPGELFPKASAPPSQESYSHLLEEERRSLLDDPRVRELLAEEAGAEFGLLSEEEFLAYVRGRDDLLEINRFDAPGKLIEARRRLDAEADEVDRFLRSPVRNKPLQKLVAEIYADELRHLPSGRQ